MCVCAESLMEKLVNAYSRPPQGLLPESSLALGLSVTPATKPCSAHLASGSQLLSAACGIGTWEVQTSMLRWQGLGILWDYILVMKNYISFCMYPTLFLNFLSVCFRLYLSCYKFCSGVYCLRIRLSLDIFWDASAWNTQHKSGI